MKVTKQKIYRFDLILTASSRRLLQDLRIKTNASSSAAVIRRALMVYKALNIPREKGWELVLRKRDGKAEKVLIIC